MQRTKSKTDTSFREAFWVWVKIAALSFGGPAAQIAVMHRILVDEKRWLSENRFLHALNYCMLLPGPEAQQLATYTGWLLHRTWGGLVAGTLFVLPGFVSILLLSILYAKYHGFPLTDALLYGLKPAVIAIVAEALIRIGRRVLKNGILIGLAAASFIAIFLFHIPFPLIIMGAALTGFLGGKFAPKKFVLNQTETQLLGETSSDDRATQKPRTSRLVKVAAIWLLLWFAPLLLVGALFGTASVFFSEGVFFSKTAVMTFGGAYAVLSYIAQQAVENYHWVRPEEMIDGLGMAETTPGPLIQVVQFVGFLGAYRNLGPLSPLAAGILGSIITVWVTYVPCFLWIFMGAPYIEYLRGKKNLSTMLSGVTAAVVGVILNLALWFSIHTLFRNVQTIQHLGIKWSIPEWGTVDPVSLLIAALAFISMVRFKVSMILTLLGSVAIGIAYHLLFRS